MGFPDGTWQAAVGGAVLGTSATVMLATTGKLIGISGIVDGALSRAENRGWKTVFLAGLAAGGVAAGILYPEGLDQTGAPPISTLGLTVSGFLVGLGTRLGNGCTSGHGLCGLARLSRRSLVATLTFLTSAVATASIMAAWSSTDNNGSGVTLQESPIPALRYLALTLTSAAAVFNLAKRAERESWKAHLASYLCGGTLGGGLVLSGMVKRAKVVDFLELRRDSWDASLAIVLGFGVLTAFAGFPFVTRRLGGPACRREDVKGAKSESESATPFGTFEIPTNTVVDLPLVLGAWLFGVGWGSSGMCPGPAFVAATCGLPGPALLFLPSVVVGMKVAGPLKGSMSLPDPSWVTGGFSADKKID